MIDSAGRVAADGHSVAVAEPIIAHSDVVRTGRIVGSDGDLIIAVADVRADWIRGESS